MRLIEREISHPTHPHHKLKLESTVTPFTCNGCHEPGIGPKFGCEHCKFDLHTTCATARNTMSHPFYPKSEFWLRKDPQLRTCDACRGEVSGLVYQCPKFGFNLHPCCANLPPTKNIGNAVLLLYRELPGMCGRCGCKGGPGWGYRSNSGTYGRHLSCLNKMMVESWNKMLLGSWQALSLDADRNNNAREVQTRIPRLQGAVKNVDRK